MVQVGEKNDPICRPYHWSTRGKFGNPMISVGTQIMWVDWTRHLRTHTLTTRLGATLAEITFEYTGFRRYLHSVRQTIATLRKHRPHVVIATNPSFVLAFLLLALRKWFGYGLVSDAHYLGVRLMRPNGVLQKLLDFYNSKADLVIVTNQGHANYIAQRGGRSYVCPDSPSRTSRSGDNVIASK